MKLHSSVTRLQLHIDDDSDSDSESEIMEEAELPFLSMGSTRVSRMQRIG